MLYDPARHEPLLPIAWDAQRVRRTIVSIATDAESRCSATSYWPMHPNDRDPGDVPVPATPLYHGAAGVICALRYLNGLGAVRVTSTWHGQLDRLLDDNRRWLISSGSKDFGSYLMGDTPPSS